MPAKRKPKPKPEVEIMEERPQEYDHELAQRILERIGGGEMLTRICAEPGMPSWRTYYRWLERDDLKQAHARARLAWADHWAENIMGIALDTSGDIFYDNDGSAKIDHARVQRHRLQIDTAKWLVGKYAPRTYGEKPAVENTDDKVVQFQWIENGPSSAPPTQPNPPRLLPPKTTEARPGNLSDADWQLLSEMLSLARQALQGRDEPPAKVFSGLIAYLRRFLDGE